MTDVLRDITLRKLRLPLLRPYRLSYRTFTEFEPIVVHVCSVSGREGWGEGHISPGSSSETREGGWRFCREYCERIIGRTAVDATAILEDAMSDSKVAATAMITAIEMMSDHPVLQLRNAASLPLVAPFQALDPRDFRREADDLISSGFRTFKIKVGTDAAADLARVSAIQQEVAGRAALRIDANRGYSEADGRRFAAGLDPAGIELFEQPCAAEDWRANARVAEVSTVPLMLDEPICDVADIDRAGQIPGVGFCKLKLKRFGGLQRLRDALVRVRACGMEPVLGDGLAGEINCWMEACAAIGTVSSAGEFNGFLKSPVRLFANPMPFASGRIDLPAEYRPEIDRDVLRRHEIACERFVARA